MLTVEGAKRLDNRHAAARHTVLPTGGRRRHRHGGNKQCRPAHRQCQRRHQHFCHGRLEKPLSKVYPEIDMVTTPDGAAVAMVHCNNCTSDLNAGSICWRERGTVRSKHRQRCVVYHPV